jgi:hypothetical protein
MVKIYGPGWCMDLPEGVIETKQATPGGDLQYGLLDYYLSRVEQNDVNVETRPDCEPFRIGGLLKK